MPHHIIVPPTPDIAETLTAEEHLDRATRSVALHDYFTAIPDAFLDELDDHASDITSPIYTPWWFIINDVQTKTGLGPMSLEDAEAWAKSEGMGRFVIRNTDPPWEHPN